MSSNDSYLNKFQQQFFWNIEGNCLILSGFVSYTMTFRGTSIKKIKKSKLKVFLLGFLGSGPLNKWTSNCLFWCSKMESGCHINTSKKPICVQAGNQVLVILTLGFVNQRRRFGWVVAYWTTPGQTKMLTSNLKLVIINIQNTWLHK